ncbi:hypothetical protein MOV66_15935 [Agrobacterium sp. SHOUNA12C]|jgi:hypothetical protein|uniref:Ethyl tert-butyl ether degradation EthD n=1 Tax=Rhizobium rhizogenes (strain K84 / ATCC BAA-868) TaxID=311403 RepID=B9JMY3_RHIR8|nr:MULTISPECIES: hypothetical protein [Rhizobium]ACM28914.1 conserved hypothetical protein [Rhizobium rhizogenes K84]KAA6486210.1 hypothetical protein DXT98_17650 [Agrobacterium sp. ICMP 7243]MCJ9724050.1 hypothetical protein [Agrobacterium sp. BETTINA12B]MCJ9758140.1 hypothetical protein [Agrobacterium sp. SHOUNA12C]OCI93482.1 hypothetical protein A6U85_19965 [Agrobacterium sp. 13-626]OCJ18831.1 hypothetical protein A6U88_13205 [Agrobacterium sp. B131/95]OCJ20660.1 hypothetical protein A6U8
MFTRSAIFEGAIHAGREEEFFRIVEEKLLPVWKRMPNAQAVRVMRTGRSDPGAAPIIMVQEIDYPSMEAVEEALASPVRLEGRAITDEMMSMCDGRFYHLVYQRIA